MLGGFTPRVFLGLPLKVQEKTLRLWAGAVALFLYQCDRPLEAVDSQLKVKARTLGYDAPEAHTAERVIISQVRATLFPPFGIVG